MLTTANTKPSERRAKVLVSMGAVALLAGCGGANIASQGLPAASNVATHTSSQPNGANGSSTSTKARSPLARHIRYIVKDLGTLGGPLSEVAPDGTTIFENARGNVVGGADT